MQVSKRFLCAHRIEIMRIKYRVIIDTLDWLRLFCVRFWMFGCFVCLSARLFTREKNTHCCAEEPVRFWRWIGSYTILMVGRVRCIGKPHAILRRQSKSLWAVRSPIARETALLMILILIHIFILEICAPTMLFDTFETFWTNNGPGI